MAQHLLSDVSISGTNTCYIRSYPQLQAHMPTPIGAMVFFEKIYAFNHTHQVIWSTDDPAPEGVTASILMVDYSYSMSKHKKALAMAVASMLEDTNVDKNFAVPEPDGETAMVQAIEEIMGDDAGNTGKTVYLIGDGCENKKVGTLPIGRDSEQTILQSLELDFTGCLEEVEAARHYGALVDYFKFKRITLVMLALGDTVKKLLKGLANTKDIYLAHLDFDEDIDNMMQIADQVKKMARRGGTQTTLIEVPEAAKILSRKNAVNTQTQQRLKKILGGITVGDKLPGTVEDLEKEMTAVIDEYLEKGGMQCANEHRLYINAHLLFFFSKCTEKRPVPAVIISGKHKNRLVEFPKGSNDGQYSKCLNQLCGKFVNAKLVLEKEGETLELGFFISHKGVSRHFGAKCAMYSCKYELCVVEELADKETFCVARELIEMPARVVGNKSKASSPP